MTGHHRFVLVVVFAGRSEESMPRRTAPEAEESGDLSEVVDSSQGGTLGIGIVEREELLRRRKPGQIRSARKDKPVIREPRGVLPHQMARIIKLIWVREIGKRKVEVVELPIRSAYKAVLISGRVVKDTADEVARVDAQHSGQHGSRCGVLERSKHPATIKEADGCAQLSQVIITNNNSFRIDPAKLEIDVPI